jgi:hypothetical protein
MVDIWRKLKMNTSEILDLILSRYVVAVGGRYSRGKSLILSALGFFDIAMNNRISFLTNMPVNYDKLFKEKIDYTPLVSTSQFDNIPRGSNIVMDEAQQDLNARNSSSTTNRFLTVFGRDVAKLDCRLRISFQNGDTLDKVIGFAIDAIIIPEYLETYSKNIKEDNIQRIENKDFRLNLTVYDRRDGEQYFISGKNFNLYPMIFTYDTRFKMNRLYVNHKDFLERLKGQNKEYYELNHVVEIQDRLDNWNTSMKNIGDIKIR